MLEIANSLGVAVDAQLVISGQPGPDIVKPVTISPAATSVVRVELSGEELRSFLGQADVTLSGSGTVAATPSTANLTPDLVIIIDTVLDLILLLGGGDAS